MIKVMKHRFLKESLAFTLTEIMVTVGILALTSAVLLPKMMGSTDGVKDQQAINTLESAWEGASQYYQGDRGPGVPQGPPDQYTGFDPTVAAKISGQLGWTSSALTTTSSSARKVSIAVVAAASTDDTTGDAGQELGLCTASANLVFCKYDDGKNSSLGTLGPRYGAGASQAAALGRAKDSASGGTVNNCTASTAKARLYSRSGAC